MSSPIEGEQGMKDLKVGDQIEVTSKMTSLRGFIGTVVAVDFKSFMPYTCEVTGEAEGPRTVTTSFMPEELSLREDTVD